MRQTNRTGGRLEPNPKRFETRAYITPQSYTPTQRKHTRKRRQSFVAAILTDTAVMAFCLFLLCAYLFLIPRPLPAEGETVISSRSSNTAAPVPQATFKAGIAQPGNGTKAGQSQETAIAQEKSANRTVSPSAAAQDPGGWFPAKYIAYGTIQTDTSYQSPDVNLTIQKVQENGITYFVADIYVRSLANLRTYFANDTYGAGYRQGISDMAAASGAILAISGDYYGNQSKGVVIRNGTVYRKSVSGDVCVLYQDGTMATYDQSGFSIDQAIAQGAYQAWSFGPKLLRDGQPMTKFNTSVGAANPRAAMGYYEPGHYCFVVVDGRQEGYSKGMTMTELSQLFYELGCKDAYNLDGGQTAQMYFGASVINQPYHGGRNVSDIIYIGE